MPFKAILCAVLVILTLAVYIDPRHHQFLHFDDPLYVTENPFVKEGLAGKSILWAFGTYAASNWHPLAWLSHMLDVELFGLNPSGHHMVNVLLHAMNAVLLFLVLTQLTGAMGCSAFVAALFAVHPLHVESVAWISERKDLLSTLFGLLILWAYGRHAVKPQFGQYLLVITFFILSLLSKPMWVTAPFLLLLLDFWPLQRVKDSPLAVDRAVLCRHSFRWLALSSKKCPCCSYQWPPQRSRWWPRAEGVPCIRLSG
jgi:protein O-mannosyl-transferase